MNGTLQDRLVQELKLAGIGDIASANAFLEKQFLKEFNQRFARTPAGGLNLHQKLPAGVKLGEVLCQIKTRTVGQDWCIRWFNRILQLDRRHEGLGLAGKEIEVLSGPDGPLKLRYRGQSLRWKEASCRPVIQEAQGSAEAAPIPRQPWRPGPEHPWKKPAVKAAALRADSLRSPSLRSAALTAPP